MLSQLVLAIFVANPNTFRRSYLLLQRSEAKSMQSCPASHQFGYSALPEANIVPDRLMIAN